MSGPTPQRGALVREALRAWRRRRDHARRDVLWLAACWEARGDEAALTMARELVAAAASCLDRFCAHATASECLFWVHWRRARLREHRRGDEAAVRRATAAAELALARRMAEA